ncbi:Ferric reduction oxidase [Thalictrum thalictroides]|uniref:ferric-chelate reductase (NADH) n=1 Tax=Thalictrum thalictroides TaxID=46969 RepID=A0A7J6X6N7_THATH|nr:Ferric reduction oxidase [Thalictrum thalictroides]
MDFIAMKKMFRIAIKFLILVVFLGSIMLWIMMPTSIYSNIWTRNIQPMTNSTYLGERAGGGILLIYTFPILFIAALGCVYLHLEKKCGITICSESTAEEKKAVSLWKRPIFVKGPLGIVFWTELAFIVMFIALLVWSFAAFLKIGFSQIVPQLAAESGEQVWQVNLEIAALRLGNVGNICLALLFFPVTRGSSVLPLVGLTSEASIKYHIWIGHITMTLFTAHGVLYIIYWIATNQLSETLEWDKIWISNVAGELSLLFGLGMWVTSFARIRRRMFELFFYTHNLYTLFFIFFVLHCGISFSFYAMPGLYLFLIDRYLRFLQSRQKVCVLSSHLLPCETLELNFSKNTGLEYSPTSIIFINVPSISKLQWHPYTITSSSNLEPEKLSVVIGRGGSWSQKLYQMLSTPSSVERLEVAVEGPYGPASTHFLRHDSLVLVSGGTGVTPFFSIIREVIFQSTTLGTKTPQILLICVFRNSADLTMLDFILPGYGSLIDSFPVKLQIEAYVTREKHPPMSTDDKNPIRTVSFKPSVGDMPISEILGPNSWLWLGVIISCSFVVFLVMLGIITRFYIYPIDHNTNMIYPSYSRAVISMLLICGCITLIASAVVVMIKKQNAIQAGKKTQDIDASSPTGFYSTDRELESLPKQSLIQATNVHYGSRPDLKMIISKCEGSSIGVLVSGPRKLRHDVATICSSGLADNLHFETISFSW